MSPDQANLSAFIIPPCLGHLDVYLRQIACQLAIMKRCLGEFLEFVHCPASVSILVINHYLLASTFANIISNLDSLLLYCQYFNRRLRTQLSVSSL